jgi:hypothetical protein
MLFLFGGKAPIVTPTDFGTLVAWFDPRFELSESAGAVTDWNDHSANAHNGTVIGAPTYEATGWNSAMPSVLFDGSDDGVHADAVATFASGSDVPLYVVCAWQVVTRAASKTLWAFGNSASNTRHHSMESVSSDRAQLLRRDDAATQVTNITSANAIDGSCQIASHLFHGTTSDLYLDGTVNANWNGAALNVGSVTLNTFSLGYRRGSANINFGHVRFGPILIYSSLTDRAGAEQWIIDQGYVIT